MRAAVVHGPGDLRIEEIPEPEPAAGEIVVEIEAALTCGTDAKTLRNGHPAAPPYPFVLGHEMAGRIVAAGTEWTRFPVGTRVVVANSAPCLRCSACRRGEPFLCRARTFLTGAFAERIRVPEPIARLNVHRVPETLESTLAALTEPLACAVLAVERSGVHASDQVAVVGAGPLGLMLCAVLAAAGSSVVAVDPHPDRLALAERFGAASTIRATRDHSDVAAIAALSEDGDGVDQVFEAVGSTLTWGLAIAMARPGGTVNLFGGCPPGSSVELPAGRLHYDQLRLQGSFHHTPDTIAKALTFVASGQRPWGELLGPAIGLDGLASALMRKDPNRPPKFVVDPRSGRAA